MIVQNKGSGGYHRDLMNHRMETIFWLTKHSDFVLSHGVDVQPGKPEHAVCLHGWDKGTSQKPSGRNPSPIHSVLLESQINNMHTFAANTWHTCPGRNQTGK